MLLQFTAGEELGVPPQINKKVWLLHCIPIGVLFSFVTLYVFSSIMGLICERHKMFQRRHFFLLMNLALFYFSLVMSLALLIDPFEERRFIQPRKARQVLNIFIRLRLPCLTTAFSLIQVSLLTVTEVILYSTWFHNTVIISITIAIHVSLVIIAGVSQMFIANSMLVWLICDIFMFFLFVGNGIISLYSGVRIIMHYHKNDKNRLKVVSSNTISSTTSSEEMNVNGHCKCMEGEINAAYILNDVESNDFTSISHVNENEESNRYTEKKRTSSVLPNRYPIYVDTKKAVVQKRRIGSLPYKTRSSKFSDKSIRKVAILMVITAIFGLLMCITIVLAISTAKIFHSDHLGVWEWFALRTVRRICELGSVATMSYMTRRQFSCC